MDEAEFQRAVLTELDRARNKFPKQDAFTTTLALCEETGEVCKAILQFAGEKHKGIRYTDIWEECIQTAVMAMRVALDCNLKNED